MDGSYNDKPVVLVVHCVDTEGPIGGNVRRKPDGSKEFMDNWKDIKGSLSCITNEKFRNDNSDSLNNKFKLNWFIMDFTGFSTNPKNRIAQYNDTYDNIKGLNTSIDSFHWHYHQPPICGTGDMWSDDWDSSKEHYNILGHRLMDRLDFPEAFRAGGTIEDNKCSLWLENNFMIDYSNRVSHRSKRTDNIFDFNWFGAPDSWGYYHPDSKNLIKKGEMRRVIARSVDLESRLHSLQQWQVDESFIAAKKTKKPILLSYFSHDHRDMVPETKKAIKMIKDAESRYKIDFKWCDALEAIQILMNKQPIKVKIGIDRVSKNKVKIFFDKEIFQKNPFVYTQDANGKITYHELDLIWVGNSPLYLQKCFLNIPKEAKKIGIACTSMSGNKSLLVEEL